MKAMTDPTLPAEFALIARHFRPLAGPGALDLGDDAALLAPPMGRELVLTVDAMIAGVHFLPDDPPDLVGRKLLRVNLSDLAAKGATPLGYLMTVCRAARHAGRLVRRLRGRPRARPGSNSTSPCSAATPPRLLARSPCR